MKKSSEKEDKNEKEKNQRQRGNLLFEILFIYIDLYAFCVLHGALFSQDIHR